MKTITLLLLLISNISFASCMKTLTTCEKVIAHQDLPKITTTIFTCQAPGIPKSTTTITTVGEEEVEQEKVIQENVLTPSGRIIGGVKFITISELDINEALYKCVTSF